MPCSTINMTPEIKRQQESALERLDKALATGSVSVVIGVSGGLAFKGWAGEKGFLTDVCAYRRLLASNSASLRKAVARAEAMSGRKLNPAAIASGTHSHDGGVTWSKH